ncbi:MAG: hypothetical protein ABIR34_13585, partial [Marmoricola sp.]
GADHAKSCGWRFKRLPAELRADLKAARALPAGERRPAVRKIVRGPGVSHVRPVFGLCKGRGGKAYAGSRATSVATCRKP